MTDLRKLAALRREATPGPWGVMWPSEQGGQFQVWGKQGTREAGFTDGWAIPFVAGGVQSNMDFVAATGSLSAEELEALADCIDALDVITNAPGDARPETVAVAARDVARVFLDRLQETTR